jgi:serine protease Do
MLKLFGKIAGLSLFLCILTGCGLVLSIKKTTFIPKTKGASISVTKINTEDTFSFQHIGNDSCAARLNNFVEIYLVKQQKQGYKNNYYPIERSNFNWLRLIDLFIPLTCDALFISSAVTGNDGLIAPSLIGGTIGWAMVIGPWSKYPKKINLPEMLQLPERNNGERMISVDKISLNVKRKDYVWNYYESLKKYKKNDIQYFEYSEEDLNFGNRMLADTLIDFLKTLNYSDSTEKLLKDPLKYTNLNCEIRKISIVSASGFINSKIQMHFSLNDAVINKVLVEKDIEANSNWDIYKNGDKGMAINIVADALINGTIKFLNDTSVKEALKNPESPFLAIYSKWQTIKYHVTDEKANTVNDAVNAVVTVKVNDGHGSGCVISNDSYIITNYHVVKDTTSKIEIILEDGSKYIAQIVRVNPLYDLALLKTQALKLKPLTINNAHEINMGSEVYSIGTPENIELGQTINKGIISGKRSFGKQTLIQTDVSINKGNSGGALINSSGELIGIISSKLIGIGVEGIGFAIPSYSINEELKISLEN